MEIRRRTRRAGLLLVSALALAACSNPAGTQSRAPAPSSQPAGSLDQSTRTCDESVFGAVPPGRDDAIVTGDLTFLGLRLAAGESPLGTPGDRTGIVKSLILLGAGASVTISVEPAARSHARLMYTAESLERGAPNAPLSVGTPSITLTGCPDRESQFNGGFIVDGPQCLPLDIAQAGRPAERITVSLGAGSCAS